MPETIITKTWKVEKLPKKYYDLYRIKLNPEYFEEYAFDLYILKIQESHPVFTGETAPTKIEFLVPLSQQALFHSFGPMILDDIEEFCEKGDKNGT